MEKLMGVTLEIATSWCREVSSSYLAGKPDVLEMKEDFLWEKLETSLQKR